MLANMKRIRATRILDQSRAIACAFDSKLSVELLREAGGSEQDVMHAELNQLHQQGRDRARSILGGNT